MSHSLPRLMTRLAASIVAVGCAAGLSAQVEPDEGAGRPPAVPLRPGDVAAPALPDETPYIPPALSPATQVELTQEIAQALKNLADREPAARSKARESLMTLPPTAMPLLRDAVKAARPLMPAQAEALPEIVRHLYLAGRIDRRPQVKGFLGINLTPTIADVDAEEPNATDAGVLVLGRICGYCAFPVLRDGDTILSVAPTPPDGAVSMPARVRSVSELQAAIGSLAAGVPVTLVVLRTGVTLEIHLRLDPRPATLMAEEELGLREAEASRFWLEQFSGLVASVSAQ